MPTQATISQNAIAAARDLIPIIKQLRQQTESDRRLAPPIVEGLRAARLCRMAVCQQSQGLELPTPDALDVLELFAGAEASVGWIVWNNELPCFFGRYLGDDVRAEVFDDPTWLYASSTRPTGRAAVERDGYRVNGRWSLVSGCELAEWLAMLCIVEEDGAPRMIEPNVPEMRAVLLRRGDYEILDTWHVSGLRGTGSHDVVVKNKHVPRRHTLALSDPCMLDAAIGRVPMISTMAAGFGAQCLGVAQTALATVLELAATKTTADPGPGLRDRPAVQAEIARQEAALEAARRYLHDCVTDVWDKVESDATPSIEDIGAVWGAAHHAEQAARAAVESMYAAGGASSIYVDCPLERAHRDLHAMTRHVVGQPFWLESVGRVRLGMAPSHPLYAL